MKPKGGLVAILMEIGSFQPAAFGAGVEIELQNGRSVNGAQRRGRQQGEGAGGRAFRFWLTGSMSMPLQISPTVVTLRKTLAFVAFPRKAATRASGVSRVSSDGMLVSTKYPVTIRYPGLGLFRAQNSD